MTSHDLTVKRRTAVQEKTGPCEAAAQIASNRYLSSYIEVHHSTRLTAWELAVVRSLAACRDDLDTQQAAALSAIWRRIQGERAS